MFCVEGMIWGEVLEREGEERESNRQIGKAMSKFGAKQKLNLMRSLLSNARASVLLFQFGPSSVNVFEFQP